MEGDQRGGAGGVDGEGGPFEAEGVGDAAGDDARRVAGEQVAVDGGVGADDEGGVVLPVGADEDPGTAAAQAARVHAGAFDRLPGGLQEQPLLRVHGQGLARRDAEEGRVEVGGVVDEPALAGVEGAVAPAVGVVEALDVPAAVGGQVGEGVGPGGDQLPEVFGGAGAAGEAAADADDRQRLGAARLDRAQAPVRLFELRRGPLEEMAEFLLGGGPCAGPRSPARGGGRLRAVGRVGVRVRHRSLQVGRRRGPGVTRCRTSGRAA